MYKPERATEWDVIRVESTERDYVVNLNVIDTHVSTWSEFLRWANAKYNVKKQCKRYRHVVVE